MRMRIVLTDSLILSHIYIKSLFMLVWYNYYYYYYYFYYYYIVGGICFMHDKLMVIIMTSSYRKKEGVKQYRLFVAVLV